MKKIFSIILAAAILAGITSIGTVFATGEAAVETQAVVFSDVNDATPGAEAIKKLVNAGIIHGYEDGTFRPNNFLTRAELSTMINLVFGYTEPAEENFWDVTEDLWYYSQVLIAKKSAYIVGFEDGSFGGDRSLTREQVCAVINRCADLMPLDIGMTVSDKVSDWAVEDVNKIVSNFLMPLEENNTFRATESITRTELAQVLSYFVADVTIDVSTPAPTQKPVTVIGGGGGTGGGSSTGGGTTTPTPTPAPTPTPTPEVFDNTLIVTNLNNTIEQIWGSGIRFSATERTVLVPVRRGIDGALSVANDVALTKEYIRTTYAADIDEAQVAFGALDEDAQSALISKIANALDSETLSFLLEYFLSGEDFDYDINI